LILTLAAAAGLIVGAFMDWVRSLTGVKLTGRAFIQTTFRQGHAFTTVGVAMIVLGLLALVGMAFRSGWLTRLAGAVGIVGFVMFAIEIYRANLNAADIQAGAWLALAGAVVALVAGFLGTRPAAVVAPAAVPPAP
jgi:hypothetical protein